MAGSGSRRWRYFLRNANEFSIGSNQLFCSCALDSEFPACLAGPFGTSATLKFQFNLRDPWRVRLLG